MLTACYDEGLEQNKKYINITYMGGISTTNIGHTFRYQFFTYFYEQNIGSIT